jgi:ferredoxin
MPAVVNAEKCDACGTCVDSCPSNAITVPEKVAVVSTEECIDCAACESACPNGAITMES